MNIENSLLQEKVNRGIKYFEENKFDEATEIFENLKLNKNTKNISNLFLGIISIKKKENTKAKKYFDKILENDPSHQDANLNLGLVYFAEKNYERAGFYFDKVNKNFTAIYHKGLINFFTKKYDEAIRIFENCININKNFIFSYLNLGHVNLRLKKFNDAIKNYKKFLEKKPEDNISKFNLAWSYFGISDLENGFKFYEYRKEKTEPKEKTLEVIKKLNPIEWNDENLNNKKIIIISEQGIGDNIQFFRYLFSLKENYNCEIIFYTDKNLQHLFRNTPFKIVTNLQNLENIDYFQNLLSLPGIFYKKNKLLKGPINYIPVDKEKSLIWKNKLKKFNKPIIALNWQGNKDFLFDDERSIELIKFKNILNIQKYNFISLQKYFGSDQINKYNFSNLIYDLSSQIDVNENAFEDTISILNNINLLITTDTALAHLAGTMGIKTYLLLSYNPEWRWFIEIQKQCFYPGIKIIQQKEYGNWNSVFNQLEDILV